MPIFSFNLNSPADTKAKRLLRAKREGSPYFTWTVPATAAAAVSVIYVPTEFPESEKYEYLDSLEIVNNEAALDLTLTINGKETHYVPASSARMIKGRALWHLAITNGGGAATTLGKIIVSMRRRPQDADMLAAKQ